MQISMRAVVLEGPGQEAVMKEIPIPTPQSGQVLIKVDSAPINPSDIAFLHGAYSSNKQFPCVPGFEGSGTVIANGGGIMGWRLVGKRVAFYSQSQFGSYGEYSIADAMGCLELDNDITLQEASCSFVNPLTVISMLEVAKDHKTQAVVHTAAASQLGRMMIRHFQANGVRVINIIRRDAQVDMLKKEGADIILNQSDSDFLDKLKNVTQTLRATVFFDALGGELTGQILEAMPNHSICYVYGGLSLKPVGNVSILDLIFKDKKVQGFWLTQYLKKKNIVSQALLLNQLKGLLKTNLKTIVAKTVDVSDFKEGLEFYKKNMSEGKVLIRYDQKQSQQQQLQQQ
ncbi:unnamed protein product [Paramecium sonneborni]|uniref:Enoyl reductase (ER) domain-containing protein n=1 Tax=Paramecium sonneborni TaxID=65129 RepID=A0A8S1Q574_9CILI|nr:unnamed protein product [Paramecium sonneborni]